MRQYRVPPGLIASVLLCLLLSACALQPPVEASAAAHRSAGPESLIDASLTDRLGRPLAVVVDSRQAQENWLFLSGFITEDDGRDFDFSTSPYQSAIATGAFENRFMALLQGVGGPQEYQLLELSYGATDTPVERWIEQYRLPLALFGGYQGSESLQWQ